VDLTESYSRNQQQLPAFHHRDETQVGSFSVLQIVNVKLSTKNGRLLDSDADSKNKFKNFTFKYKYSYKYQSTKI